MQKETIKKLVELAQDYKRLHDDTDGISSPLTPGRSRHASN